MAIIYKLKEICKLQKGKHYPNINKSEYWNGDYSWLRISDIEDNIYETDKSLSQLGIETVKNYKKYQFKRNSFVMAFYGATIGKLGWLCKNFYSSANLVNFTTNQKIILNKFLYYWFFKNIKNFIKKQVKGSAIPYLNIKDISEIKIKIPSLIIQKKIIDIIEPVENLFLKYSKCVRIDNFENVKNDIKNLIDIIEPLEKLEEWIILLRKKIEKFIKNLSITNNYLYLKEICQISKKKAKNLQQISSKMMNKNSSFIKKFEKKQSYKSGINFCKKKTLIINKITYLKKFCILPEDSDVCGETLKVEIKKNYLSIINNLLNNHCWKQLNRYSKGLIMQRISISDLLNKIKIFLIEKKWENENFIDLLMNLNLLKIKSEKIKIKMINLLVK